MRPHEEIQGEILQIIFANAMAKFAVVKVEDVYRKHIFTAAGNIHGPKVGAMIKLKGFWEKNHKHGIQFKTIGSEIAVPGTLTGIIKYLGSGFVNAVGPRSARRIVDFFGENTIHVLENEIEKLILVPGIGPGRLRNISLAWNDQNKFNIAIRKNVSS